jgi:hypothetical protein
MTKWTPELLAELRAHVRENKLFMKEIAKEMGLPTSAVLHKCRQLGIRTRPPGRFAEWNSKHRHLREAVLRFFLKHSLEETAKHFKLTPGELKSCLSYAYKQKDLMHLRKSGKNYNPWKDHELVFALQHIGIQPRAWISRKLGRSNTYEPVKEMLQEHANGAQSRYLNGMPLSMALIVFGEQIRDRVIQTKAGPRGNSRQDGSVRRRCDFAYKILPWIEAEEMLDRGLTRPLIGKGKCTSARRARAPRLQVSREIESMIRAMAQFQRWLHGVSSARQIRSRILAAIKRR